MSVLNTFTNNWNKIFKRVNEEDMAAKGESIAQLEEEKLECDIIASLEQNGPFKHFMARIAALQAKKIELLRNCDGQAQSVSVLQAEDRTYQSVLEMVPKARVRSAEIRKKLEAMMREDGIV